MWKPSQGPCGSWLNSEGGLEGECGPDRLDWPLLVVGVLANVRVYENTRQSHTPSSVDEPKQSPAN